jgi:hypothetical protein
VELLIQADQWDMLFSAMAGKPKVFKCRNDGTFDVFTDTGSTRGNHFYVSNKISGCVDRVPADAVPAELGPLWKDGWRRVSHRNLLSSREHNGIISFVDFVNSQPVHIQLLLGAADLTDNTVAIVANRVFTAEHLACGSDGGMLNGHGTFGFVWADCSSTDALISCRGQVPGHMIGMSSTRTELCGIFAAMCYVQLVIKYHHIVVPRTPTTIRRTIFVTFVETGNLAFIF